MASLTMAHLAAMATKRCAHLLQMLYRLHQLVHSWPSTATLLLFLLCLCYRWFYSATLLGFVATKSIYVVSVLLVGIVCRPTAANNAVPHQLGLGLESHARDRQRPVLFISLDEPSPTHRIELPHGLRCYHDAAAAVVALPRWVAHRCLVGVGLVVHRVVLATERHVRYEVNYVQSHTLYRTLIFLSKLFAMH